MLVAVITTIQEPTPSVLTLAEFAVREDFGLIVAGDSKGPDSYPLSDSANSLQSRLVFLSLQDQLDCRYELVKQLPINHYCRKNIGYLKAMELGATCIYETDDDNAPLPTWKPRSAEVEAIEAVSRQWVNAYKYFSDQNIWPRGFPLDEISQSDPVVAPLSTTHKKIYAPIQQGLANGSPDVDAIWRLVLDDVVTFDELPSMSLPPGSWCPFNSQSTWWWPEAYTLMYLPSYCSFRMTDIWRSFIAQRCLWEMGCRLVFHAAEVVQERNEHNLMRDFSDEVAGYLRNKELVESLTALNLESGPDSTAQNLRQCYATLIEHEFFPPQEMELVKAWLSDLEQLSVGAI